MGANGLVILNSIWQATFIILHKKLADSQKTRMEVIKIPRDEILLF